MTTLDALRLEYRARLADLPVIPQEVITQPMPADAASVRIAAREERAKVADEIFGAHALRSPP